MFLKDEELKNGIIDGAQENGFGSIAYDLVIKDVLPTTGHCEEYAIKPGETIFASTAEVITVPENMFAQVVTRNSAIRMGLTVIAPLYQPGHKTRIFFRVSNASEKTVTISRGDSVCSLMIYRLSEPSAKPYGGVYADEFDYRGVGNAHAVKIPTAGVVEEKLKALEKMESRLYGNVMMMLTVFVAIFSLVNLNMSTLRDNYNLVDVLTFNAMFLGVISTLVLLVAEILGELQGRKRRLFLIPLLAFTLATVILATR